MRGCRYNRRQLGAHAKANDDASDDDDDDASYGVADRLLVIYIVYEEAQLEQRLASCDKKTLVAIADIYI